MHSTYQGHNGNTHPLNLDYMKTHHIHRQHPHKYGVFYLWSRWGRKNMRFEWLFKLLSTYPLLGKLNMTCTTALDGDLGFEGSTEPKVRHPERSVLCFSKSHCQSHHHNSHNSFLLQKPWATAIWSRCRCLPNNLPHSWCRCCTLAQTTRDMYWRAGRALSHRRRFRSCSHWILGIVPVWLKVWCCMFITIGKLYISRTITSRLQHIQSMVFYSHNYLTNGQRSSCVLVD